MHQTILKAMYNLGYDKGWVLTGDTYEGIEWIVEPEVIPSKEQVLAKVAELEVLEQAELDAKAAAKESAIGKLTALGLSENEIKALVGA